MSTENDINSVKAEIHALIQSFGNETVEQAIIELDEEGHIAVTFSDDEEIDDETEED